MAVDYFQPETFQQANPLLSGMQAGQQIFSQGVQNAYLPQTLAQQLQMLRAQTGAQQALPNYYGALAQEARGRGNMFGAQANLLGQETPSLVQQQQNAVYTDPILSRLRQLQMAQQTGAISPDMLTAMGFGAQGSVPAGTNNLQNQAQQLGQPGNSIIPMTPQQQRTLDMVRQSSLGAQPQQGMPNQTGDPSSLGTNPAQNWAIFGSPLNPLQMMQLKAMGSGMETQATSGITQWNSAQDDAAKSADLGTQISQLANQFQANYKNSTYKGGLLGKIPTTGFESLPARLGSEITSKQGGLAAEQATDNASQNMAAMVAKMIAGGRVTNYEMQYINNLKPNRAMDPATAQMASDFLKQKSIRMSEEQDFLNAARNQGIPVQNANSLWQQYNNQRPVYDFSQNQPNTQFQKTWKDYLTPQAVSAVQNGQNYVPMPQFNSSKDFQSWVKTLNPSDQKQVISQLGNG